MEFIEPTPKSATSPPFEGLKSKPLWIPLGALLLFAFALRLILVVYVAPYPERYIQGDAVGYDQLAINLVEGHGFSMSPAEPYQPNNFRTPGYPVLIAVIYQLFGYRPELVLYLQALLGTLTLLVIFQTASLIIHQKAAFLATALLSISPLTMTYEALLWSETLFTFFLCLVIYASIRMLIHPDLKWVLASGLVIGITTLIHLRSLYLPFIIAAGLIIVLRQKGFLWKRILLLAVLYLVIFQLVLLPWHIRNMQVFGVPNLSSISGINMLYYGAALTEAAQTGEEQWSIARRYEAEIRKESPAPLNEAEFSERAVWAGIKKIVMNPLVYAQIHLIGMAKIFLPGIFQFNQLLTGEENINTGDIFQTLIVLRPGQDNLIQMIFQLRNGIILLFIYSSLYLTSLYGLCIHAVVKNVRKSIWLWFFLSIIFYMILITGPAGTPRFQVAIIPILCIIAGFGSTIVRKPSKTHMMPSQAAEIKHKSTI